MRMSKETKFGYGFLFAGVGLPYLIEKLFGPLTALIIAALCTLAGVALLGAGHLHREKEPIGFTLPYHRNRNPLALTVGLIVALTLTLTWAVARVVETPNESQELAVGSAPTKRPPVFAYTHTPPPLPVRAPPRVPKSNGPSLDIICQHLADCPSEELSKRAIELAGVIEQILNERDEQMKKILVADQDIPKNSPDYARIHSQLNPDLRGINFVAYNKYEGHHADVVAMRRALSDRLGDHNQSKDDDYALAGGSMGPNFAVGVLPGIMADLKDMAGRVRAMRQQ